MKVTVTDKSKKELNLVFLDEDHTFANVLRRELVASGAEMAAYRIPHPLEPNLEFKVRAASPVTASTDAAASIEKQAKEFKKKFSDACKK